MILALSRYCITGWGTCRFAYSFIIPSSSPPSERSNNTHLRYLLTATALGAGRGGRGDISTTRAVSVILQVQPDGGPTPLDMQFHDYHDALGLFNISLLSASLTVGGTAAVRVLHPDPPEGLTVHVVRVFLVQTVELYSEQRQAWVKLPPETLRLWEKGVMPYKSRRPEHVTPQDTIWFAEADAEGNPGPGRPGRGAGAGKPNMSPFGTALQGNFLQHSHAGTPEVPSRHLGDGHSEGYALEGILRLPNHRILRPTTLKGSRTDIRVSHEIGTEVFFSRLSVLDQRPNSDSFGLPKVQVFSMRSEAIIPSCTCTHDTIHLPPYSPATMSPQPSRPVSPHAQAGRAETQPFMTQSTTSPPLSPGGGLTLQVNQTEETPRRGSFNWARDSFSRAQESFSRASESFSRTQDVAQFPSRPSLSAAPPPSSASSTAPPTSLSAPASPEVRPRRRSGLAAAFTSGRRRSRQGLSTEAGDPPAPRRRTAALVQGLTMSTASSAQSGTNAGTEGRDTSFNTSSSISHGGRTSTSDNASSADATVSATSGTTGLSPSSSSTFTRFGASLSKSISSQNLRPSRTSREGSRPSIPIGIPGPSSTRNSFSAPSSALSSSVPTSLAPTSPQGPHGSRPRLLPHHSFQGTWGMLGGLLSPPKQNGPPHTANSSAATSSSSAMGPNPLADSTLTPFSASNSAPSSSGGAPGVPSWSVHYADFASSMRQVTCTCRRTSDELARMERRLILGAPTAPGGVTPDEDEPRTPPEWSPSLAAQRVGGRSKGQGPTTHPRAPSLRADV